MGKTASRGRSKPVCGAGCLSFTLVFGALTGCGGNIEVTDTAHAGDAGARTSGDVLGTMIDTYVTEVGDVAKPVVAALTALSPTAGGGFTSVAGKVAADGTFRIPGVPDGPFYLRIDANDYLVGPVFIFSQGRELDLGTVRLGRPSPKECCYDTTPLVLDLAGLDPWVGGDSIDVFSLGAGGQSHLVDGGSDVLVAEGATTVTGYDLNAAQLGWMGIDGTKGDRATVTQSVMRRLEGGDVLAVAKAFTPAPFSVVSGQKTTLSGTFSDVTTQSLALSTKPSHYAPFAPQVGPHAVVFSHEVRAFANAAGPGRIERSNGEERWGIGPQLFLAFDDSGSDNTIELSFGNPYPAAWGAVATVLQMFSVVYDDPATGEPLPGTQFAFMGSSMPLEELASSPLTPVLGPPTNLAVNGASAYELQRGFGPTPTLSWSAPMLGAPVEYIVAIDKTNLLGPVEGGAVFHTTTTELKIPPGLLEVGAFYTVKVTAETAVDPTAPFKRSTRRAFADTLSALLLP